ncbi:MAG: UPF0149 family protein [Pseudomonadota bacterium]
MSQTNDYTRLAATLSLLELEISPSESHGVLVGAIINHLKSGQSPDLLKLIEPEADANESRFQNLAEVVYELYRETSDTLFEATENFDLLLPDDTAPLDVRTEELANWCKGFLLGLLHNNAFGIDELSANGAEIARDFIEISEAAAGNDDEKEEDWALAELHEYVKVGAQLIFEFCYSERAQPASDQTH